MGGLPEKSTRTRNRNKSNDQPTTAADSIAMAKTKNWGYGLYSNAYNATATDPTGRRPSRSSRRPRDCSRPGDYADATTGGDPTCWKCGRPIKTTT